MTFSRGLLLLLCCLNFPVLADKNTDKFINLSFYSENYPPANYVENDELKGISIEALRLMWKHLEQPEQEIVFLPWEKAYRYTLDINNTVLFTISRTASRENLFKWVGPLFHSSHVLIAKRSKQLKFKTLGQIFDYPIAAVRGDVSEIVLYQLGFPKSHTAHVANIEQAFSMLETDRVEMIAVTIHAFADLMQKLKADISQYEQVWEINRIGNYFAFNKEVSDEIINSYQQALEAISPELDKIKASYHLPLAEY